MCGLIGVVSSTHKKKYEDLFEQGLILDTIRGKHSTGAVCVQQGGSTEFKAAVPGPDFVDMKPFDKMMNKAALNQPVAFLGHNRAATIGNVNKANSHPFDFENLVGMHNGTLRRRTKLQNDGQYSTDSETLFDHLNTNSLEDTLSKVEGAYCLVWYDKNENKVNIIRNKERPLWIAKVKDEDTVIYASEVEMIWWLCNRHNMEVEDAYEPEVDCLYSFDMDKASLAKPHVRTVKFESEYPPVYTGTQSYNRGYQGNGGAARNTGSGARSNVSNINSVNIQDEMKKHNLFKGKKVPVIPVDFEPYKAGINGKGKVEGYLTQHPFYDVTIHGLTKEDFDSMPEWLDFQVESLTDYHGDLILICSVPKATGTNVVDNLPEPVNNGGTGEKKSTDSAFFKGPDGSILTRDEIEHKVSGGCGMCGDPIHEDEYDFLEWHKETPVCPGCIDEWYSIYY